MIVDSGQVHQQTSLAKQWTEARKKYANSHVKEMGDVGR